MLALEADALQQFMIRIRQVYLKKRVARFQKNLDYVFLASADEGFLLPQRAIQCDLEGMENRLQLPFFQNGAGRISAISWGWPTPGQVTLRQPWVTCRQADPFRFCHPIRNGLKKRYAILSIT
ncbi:MAG: hypothetical protein ABIK68_11380 [bacterium]